MLTVVIAYFDAYLSHNNQILGASPIPGLQSLYMMIMISTHTETGFPMSDVWQSDSEHHFERGCVVYIYMCV